MRKIRIGTRSSKLALWQANTVAEKLRNVGADVELVEVKSQGDLDQTTPLHQFGQTGIFTRTLDIATLDETVDVAVHSLKDYPTLAPRGLKVAAWLPRENSVDVLVPRKGLSYHEIVSGDMTIATGSTRRRAQWLHRFPNHKTIELRGNVPTRLSKISSGKNGDGGILAFAGLHRLGLSPTGMVPLTWMTPAPAQGVVACVCRTDDREISEVLTKISDDEAMMASHIERHFLRTLEGGCSAPIGAYVYRGVGKWVFTGCLLDVDGTTRVDVTGKFKISRWRQKGREMAKRCLSLGGDEIMKKLRDGEA